MKIPHHDMIRAARDAFEIHCNTGLNEVLVPCNSGVPVTRQMLDELRAGDVYMKMAWRPKR